MLIKIEKLLVLNYQWFDYNTKKMMILGCTQKENPIWFLYDASNDRNMKKYIWLKDISMKVLPIRYGKRRVKKSKKNRNAYSLEILGYETYVNTQWSVKPDPAELKDISIAELNDMLKGRGVE